MIPILICLTLAHVGFRLSSEGEAQPMIVSSLEPGQAVSLPSLERVTADLEPHECLQLVAFNPDCPFCQHAAAREQESLAPESRASRVWFTDEAWPSLSDFVRDHLAAEPLVSAELFTTLHVHAVPALFVIGGEGDIRWLGAYTGEEADALLTSRCTG